MPELEPDFPLWRIRWGRRRGQDLHEILKDVDDGCFVRVEPAGELFLQRFELFRQLARAKQRLAHFYESTDDKHVDSRSPETLGRITMRPMQSIQRRPRTPYSSGPRACCEEHSPLVGRRAQ